VSPAPGGPRGVEHPKARRECAAVPRVGRVMGEDLADDQIVEEHPEGGEVLLDRGGGELTGELLNIGGDEEGLEPT
jgi:hypothetical protein